jgi:hypothetical protein
MKALASCQRTSLDDVPEEMSPLAGVGEPETVGQVESLCLEAKVPSSSAEEAVAKVALQGQEVVGREFGLAGY